MNETEEEAAERIKAEMRLRQECCNYVESFSTFLDFKAWLQKNFISGYLLKCLKIFC